MSRAEQQNSERVPVKATHGFAVIPAGSTEAKQVKQRALGQEEAMQLLTVFASINPQQVMRQIQAQLECEHPERGAEARANAAKAKHDEAIAKIRRANDGQAHR